MKKHFAYLMLLFGAGLFAQVADTGLSKLKKAVVIAKDVPAKVDALNAVGDYFFNTNLDSASVYYTKAYELSKREKYDKGIFQYAGNIGSVYVFTAQYDKMRKLMDDGITFARQKKDKHWEAVFTTNIGNVYMYTADYEKAIEHFQRGIVLFKQNNEPKYIKSIYKFMGICYLTSGNLVKGIEYGHKTAELGEKEGDQELVCEGLSTVAKCYIENKEYEKADPFVDRYIAVAKKIGKENKIYDGYFDKARILEYRKKYPEAIDLLVKAVDYNEKSGNIHNNVNALVSLAETYQKSGNAKSAMKTIAKSEKIAKDNKMVAQLLFIYETAALLFNENGNYKEAYSYLKTQQTLNDSLNSIELKKKLTEADSRFQSSEKQKQIVILESEKNRNKIYLIGLGIVILLLLVSGFFVYRYFAAKRKISDQQITQLQQEKKIVAAENMLEGEKTERTRLARDLHDGLGGMLSGVKFQLNSMKGNVILSEENANTFTKSIVQLDNAIAEMRRVAHNMMPESLLKFGLTEALGDYCSSISDSSEIEFSYQIFGMENRLEQTIEIALYRIVQELANNVIKHSGAKNAHVQLSRNENIVSLTVEDDGHGFDASASKNGMGLSNIANRVDYLNGKMDVQSDEKGTSVHIEFEV